MSDLERDLDAACSEKLEITKTATPEKDALMEGAKRFELFWLLPSRYENETAEVRLRIESKLAGWKLKDGLVDALGLQVGDTVNVEVSVELAPGIIRDANNIDLFADGEAAKWLIDTVMASGSVTGCVLDCRVKFSYCDAPVGSMEGRIIKKASLILVEGLAFVGVKKETSRQDFLDFHGIDSILAE